MTQMYEVIFPSKVVSGINTLVSTDGHRRIAKQTWKTGAGCQWNLLLEHNLQVEGDNDQESGDEYRIERVSKPPCHGAR